MPTKQLTNLSKATIRTSRKPLPEDRWIETGKLPKDDGSRAPEAVPCFKRFKHLSSVVSEKIREQANYCRREADKDSVAERQVNEILQANFKV